MNQLILASSSPRRQELLKLLGYPFSIKVANVEETAPPGLFPGETAVYVAEKKAEAICEPRQIVVAADTIVVFENEIFGKPKNREDALYMLMRLSGKNHQVYTGVVLKYLNLTCKFFEKTEVFFTALTEDQVHAYINTGEHEDKAGAYGIQGKGALLVERIEGDYYNVMGLPVSRLKRELDVFMQRVKNYSK